MAERLGWPFVEDDDCHPAANGEKFREGVPLDEAGRRPWLAALRERVDRACDGDEDIVLACSSLTHVFRDYLEGSDPAVSASSISTPRRR